MIRYLSLLITLCATFPLLDALEGVITFEALEAKVNELEKRLNEICSTENADGAVLSLISAEPNQQDWLARVDILYWQPRVGGTSFAYSNWMVSTDLPLHGRIRKIDFGWNWGLRAGLGHRFCHDEWDIDLTYTLFSKHDSKGSSAGFNSTVIPLKGSIATDTGVDRAKSQFDFDYQSLDLEMGRHFFVSGKSTLRPFIGIKSSWIDLDQLTRYTGGSFLGVRTAIVKDDSSFWGMGPKMGLDTRWDLRDGFSLIGDISAAILYGNFEVSHKERLTSSTLDLKLSDNDHRFAPMFNLFLALNYGCYINDQAQYLSLALGYEIEYWWRQNQMISVYEYDAYRFGNISEDVGMRGLTFRIALQF